MDDVWPTLSNIAADRESGAAQIARAAAEALKGVTTPELDAAIRLLLVSHPAMAPLWRLASDVISASDPVRGANDFLLRLQSDDVAATALAHVLPASILTISFSSSVIETVRQASVELLLCMRSEPGGEGERMAVAARPTASRVIEDDEAIRVVPAEAVVVGADAVTPSGVVNKVKTEALAAAARKMGVPCYVVAGHTKFVEADLSVEAPFERVPLELFSAIATSNGLLSPAEAAERATRARLHPNLSPLLAELSVPRR
jgi:translation initiation factor 2B subunit (eIF-2B alpha/beta/delta family)